MVLSPHASAVLEKRFLRRDQSGQLVEDAEGLFRRVAAAIAAVDDRYDGGKREEAQDEFFELMSSLAFLPNSPTLMNAGTADGQLAGCFVLPIEDSMESIYTTLRDVALIQKSGGGTGFSFSSLRPKGDYILTTRGVSSGPCSFIDLYDYSTHVNRLGGTRAGANMAVLRHDHPDIREFISAKRDPARLQSFNVSVMATDAFMRAVESDEEISLWFGRSADGTPNIRGHLSARALFDAIVANAWQTGDPGLLFYDRINAANPTPHLGSIEATNPCGEQPLLPFESCNLGSINVSRFVRSGSIDYAELGRVTRRAVHFLDNVLDVNAYPIPAVRAVTLGNRKIGLGIMGFADLLVGLGVGYASHPAAAIADELMAFIQQEAKAASTELAKTRGSFPAFPGSRAAIAGVAARRNACVTSIAPTGTISLLADCSSGIEPFFALSYRRAVIGSIRTMDVKPELLAALAEAVPDDRLRGRLLSDVAATGRLGAMAPPDLRALFATAHEVPPEWHVKIQAIFQRHTDTAVSKTINMPRSATTADVARAYRLAFETGCKGVTVFRDGCKSDQVLSAGDGSLRCSECGEALAVESGCRTCASCGYSMCVI